MKQKSTRTRRPQPARSGPIRDFSGLLKDTGAASASASRDNGPDPAAQAPDGEPSASARSQVDDVIADSVKLGYSVIQDQIRQGRRIAQQISGLPSGLGTNDLGPMFERMMRFSTDFGTLLTDMMETMWRSNVASIPRKGLNGNAPHPGEPGAASRSGIAIEIESARPTRVSVDLAPGADAGRLKVPGLLALNADAAPMTGIAFTSDGTGASPTLRIPIPKTQPAGHYSGAIVDADSGEPRGTLSVRISDSAG